MLPDQSEYVFTDISPLFTAKAAERFAAFEFLHCERLDVELDPTAQGFTAGSFDIVVAANVLHATHDLRQSLRHLHSLLAHGGLLILLEGTGSQSWIDLIFGLTEGWWRFRDHELRPNYPLLNRESWLTLLTEEQFEEAAVFPLQADPDDVLAQQAVFLARKLIPSTLPSPDGVADRWLIFADETGFANNLSVALADKGTPPDLVFAADSFANLDNHTWQVAPDNPESFSQLFTAFSETDSRPFLGILYLWGLQQHELDDLPGSTLMNYQMQVIGGALHLIQALANQEVKTHSRLWFVTQGGQPATNEQRPISIEHSPLWGLGRVISLEHPDLWGGLIDLDPDMNLLHSQQTLQLLEALGIKDSEEQVAYRQGRRYVARLVPTSPSYPSAMPVIREDGRYLVTGGLGTLGLLTAVWLAEQGARHITLVNRTDLPERKSWTMLEAGTEAARRVNVIQRLEADGVEVLIVKADIGEEKQVARLFAELEETAVPLRGIIHTAGVSLNQLATEIDLPSLQTILHPKLAGAWLLHQHTQTQELDFFVLFSSAAAIWGSAGAAHYAAANSFMDALAHYRHTLDLPALSINWGRLAERGMLTNTEDRLLAAIGMDAIPVPEAISAMGRLIAANVPQQTVARIDWPRFKAHYEVRGRRPLLDEVGLEPSPALNKLTSDETLFRETLDRVEPTAKRAVLVRFLQHELASVLLFAADEDVDTHQGFFEMGMDSLTAVELQQRLERELGVKLPAAVLFNYPTVEALVDHFAETVPDLGINISERHDEPAPMALESTSGSLLDQIESLTDDQVEQLLQEKLSAQGD
jgi:NAD(P)-dependent dehydrogenase (short-subunit alcohol dehydrogenase family)/acyl carrier protein/SAM-dependent methyltransferase